jgi:hypothetical protein
LSLEALNSLFAREGLEEITTTTIDVTRSFSDFDDSWRAQTPIFNSITGMITALPESDRVRPIESVQAGVPVGPGAASLIQQRECYQGRRARVTRRICGTVARDRVGDHVPGPELASVLQIKFSFEPRSDLFDHLETIGVVY